MQIKSLFFFFPPKERHQNGSNAAVSWLWWNTSPIHWVSWSGDSFLPRHPPLLYESKLIHQSPVMIQLLFIQVPLQNKKALLLQGGTPSTPATGGPQGPVGKQEPCQWVLQVGLDPPPPGLLFHAALPCSGEFIYTCIYHPITGPILIKTAISCNKGEACRRGECDQNIARRNITAHLFFNERIDWEQSLKRARHLSNRCIS